MPKFNSFLSSSWFKNILVRLLGHLLLLSVLYYRSPLASLLPASCIFCTILSLSFSILHFFFGMPHSLLASLTDQLITHHTALLANNTPASTVPLSPPYCCLLAFFTGKISKFRLSLTSNPATSSPHSPSPPATPPDFSVLTLVSESEVYKILSNCNK